MEQNSTRRPAPIGSIAALTLAAGALVAFGAGDALGMRSEAAERIFTLTWLAGWVLLTWAVLVGGASLVGLSRRAIARRPVSRLEVVLLGAGVALVAYAVSAHPLWGSGWGVGSPS